MNISILFATYSAVLTAELIGDKTIYTISILAMRCKPLPMICGFALAFMAKMLVAVLAGNVIANLPPTLVTGISAATFFTMALAIWVKKTQASSPEGEQLTFWSPQGAFVAAFAAIFFTEWGDFGQITAATLTANYHQPLTVWLGATLAMMTKGMFAMLLGVKLRERIPVNVFRYATVCICLTLGLITILGIGI